MLSLCYNSNITEANIVKKKWFYAIVTVIFLLLCLAYLISNQPSKAKEKIVTLKSGAHQQITGLVFSDYYSGKKRMELKAEEVLVGPKTIGFLKTPLIQETRMTKPEILFFDEGRQCSHITATSGRMSMNNRRIFLKDNVRLATSDGSTLSTEEMTVEPKLGFLSVKGSFVLKKNKEITRGKGLKSDIRLDEPRIRIKQSK